MFQAGQRKVKQIYIQVGDTADVASHHCHYLGYCVLESLPGVFCPETVFSSPGGVFFSDMSSLHSGQSLWSALESTGPRLWAPLLQH